MCYKISTLVDGNRNYSIVFPFALGSYLSCLCGQYWAKVLFEETKEKPPSVLSVFVSHSLFWYFLHKFWQSWPLWILASASSTHQDHQALFRFPILYKGLGTAGRKPRHLSILTCLFPFPLPFPQYMKTIVWCNSPF